MTKTRKDPAITALVALRHHLGLTQQRFAVEVMDSAVTTVARWETTFPPRGDVLLRLTTIAEKNDRPDLADVFLKSLMRKLSHQVPQPAMKRWVASNG